MNYDYKILSSETAYQGFFRLDIHKLQHQLFAGGSSDTIVRECLERGQAVVVLPYDPQRDELVLIEQFRIGALALATATGPWLIEPVAGVVESGEDTEQVARREAQEEAGCEILALVKMYEILSSPGCTSEQVTLYCGRVDSTGLGGIHGLSSEHEDIKVHVVTRKEALKLLRQGRIIAAPAVIALQWLALHHRSVRRRWS